MGSKRKKRIGWTSRRRIGGVEESEYRATREGQRKRVNEGRGIGRGATVGGA